MTTFANMPVKIGVINTLPIAKEVDFGLYLKDDEGTEILLPKRYKPEEYEIGDYIDVFIYHDSEGRIIATTETPLAKVGELAMMKVEAVSRYGAFVNWGLLKDLLIPESQQFTPLKLGQEYLIYVYLDKSSQRIAGAHKLEFFFNNNEIDLEEKQNVELILYRITPLGIVCIVNKKNIGLIHNADLWGDTTIGTRRNGVVKKIREDGKIDLAFGDIGYQKISAEQHKILTLLKSNHGFLPYHDKSSPEEIFKVFDMSKKSFKMAIGGLYKSGDLDIEKEGLKLKN